MGWPHEYTSYCNAPECDQRLVVYATSQREAQELNWKRGWEITHCNNAYCPEHANQRPSENQENSNGND